MKIKSYMLISAPVSLVSLITYYYLNTFTNENKLFQFFIAFFIFTVVGILSGLVLDKISQEKESKMVWEKN